VRAGSALEGIRLVVLDLDGTLLPETKRLSARSIDVVGALLARGIEVTLATGKGWTHTARYADELGVTAPLITMEGALVGRAGPGGRCEPVREHTVPRPLRERLCEATRDLDLGFFYCHDAGRTRAHRFLEDRLAQLQVWDPHVDVDDGRLAEGDHEAFVVHFVGVPDRVKIARSRLEELRLEASDLWHAEFWDGYDQLQVRPQRIGKHAALAEVLEELALGAGDVLACGDWWNDVEMLRMAGVGVAPANAVEGVRAEADHVLPLTNEEDGVILFLEEQLRRLAS
jgi:Cof subfamily protein (haloacid dehalogenase superfamily)